MKVSLRDFQLKPTEYLKSLPLELTRYGEVIAVVSEPEDSTVNREEKSVNSDSPPAPEWVEAKFEDKRLGRCEYRFCKEPAVGRFHWKVFDNSSGQPFEDTQNLCEGHRNAMKSDMEKQEGTFVEA